MTSFRLLLFFCCLALAVGVARADEGDDVRAMCDAAGKGDVDEVRRLLDAGANVDGTDYAGMTALQNAALTVEPEVVRLLLERGADPEITAGDGDTALLTAVAGGWNRFTSAQEEGAAEMIRAIVDAGAKLDAQNEKGETALILAAEVGDQTTFDLLVERGANAAIKNKSGETAISIAREKSRYAMTRKLAQHGVPMPVWVRVQTFFYHFARIEAWSMPFALLAIAGLAFWIDTRRPPRPKQAEVGSADGLPRLAPLKCRSCGAPVPVDAPGQQCPSCATPFEVPEDYRETFRLRAIMTENLQRAVRMWRRARILNSPPVAWFFLLLGPVWLVGTYIGLVVGDSSTLMGVSMIVGGWTFGVSLFCYGLYLLAERVKVPAIPRSVSADAEEPARCTQCGGAVIFPRGILAMACQFCGSDLYRARLARIERRRAARDEHAASASAHDAIVTLYDMRDTLVMGVFTAAFLIVGTGVVVLVMGLFAAITS